MKKIKIFLVILSLFCLIGATYTLVRTIDIDTSSELFGILTDETGSASGSPLAVFNVNPVLIGATLTGALDFNDGTGDTPKATFTPQTGSVWNIYAEDTGDDLQIEVTTASTEALDIVNIGAGQIDVSIDGDITANNLSGTNTGDNTVATSGDAAVDFFGAGVTAVTDATTCTDIEGTKLSITGGTLNCTETDSVVGAVNGVVEADGGGNISVCETLADLADPNADRIYIWDDTDNAFVMGVVGSGLTYTAATNTLSSSGSGAFSDAGDPIVQNTTTKDVVIGTGAVNTSKLTIDGDADQVQFTIQGNATQTNSLFIAEQSGGTEVLNLTNAGALTLASTVSVTENSRSTQLPGVENTGTVTAMAGQGYSNLLVKYVTVATVDIDADYVVLRDTNDVCFVAKTVNETVNIGVSGANGLEASDSEAASTWYEIYIIAKEDGTTDSLLNAAGGAIGTTPTDYVYKKLIGFVYNDSGSDFDEFYQANNFYAQAEETKPLDNGAATTFTDVDCSALSPPGIVNIYCAVETTSDDTGSVWFTWRVNGAATASGNTPTGHLITSERILAPCILTVDSSRIFEYKTNDSGNRIDVNYLGHFYNF